MALINFLQLADALDFDGVAVQNVWQAEDDVTGEIIINLLRAWEVYPLHKILLLALQLVGLRNGRAILPILL